MAGAGQPIINRRTTLNFRRTQDTHSQHHQPEAETGPELLFVYGTLLSGFENASFLASPHKAEFAGAASVKGRLFDTGYYPAFIPDTTGDPAAPTVRGELYRLKDPEVLFATLDVVEGVNHSHPERSLFQRVIMTAETGDGPQRVWVYTYNQPVDQLTYIETGDYRDYRKPGGTL